MFILVFSPSVRPSNNNANVSLLSLSLYSIEFDKGNSDYLKQKIEIEGTLQSYFELIHVYIQISTQLIDSSSLLFKESGKILLDKRQVPKELETLLSSSFANVPCGLSFVILAKLIKEPLYQQDYILRLGQDIPISTSLSAYLKDSVPIFVHFVLIADELLNYWKTHFDHCMLSSLR